jgi:hypothetical protein
MAVSAGLAAKLLAVPADRISRNVTGATGAGALGFSHGVNPPTKTLGYLQAYTNGMKIYVQVPEFFQTAENVPSACFSEPSPIKTSPLKEPARCCTLVA